ncbi:MAG: hypothetical protein ACLSWP_12425 [Terrisporobacter sp.]|uniref:hypothetical protein n=1 Tax=Terrisporobacter sp. TaxID=1965305 RepID=UPI0039948141
MNNKKRALDLFENPQKIKENRWIIWLVFLLITVCKNFIKKVIGINTYNVIIIFMMTLIGIYIIYGFIEYLKNNEKYDMKKDKLGIIISSIMILLTTSYLAYILII